MAVVYLSKLIKMVQKYFMMVIRFILQEETSTLSEYKIMRGKADASLKKVGVHRGEETKITRFFLMGMSRNLMPVGRDRIHP